MTTRETSLEVLEVSITERDAELLESGFIDKPASGERPAYARLELSGWVIGRRSPATAVEIVSEGRVVGRAAVEGSRPDVAKAFEGFPRADECGFEATMEARGSGESDLMVRAVLEDGSRAVLGRVRVRASAPRWLSVFSR